MEDVMRELANGFKALADETRLAMLGLLLSHGELCVCDFEKVLGVSQSKASRHLRYLLHAGFVNDRREGVWSLYRVADKLTADQRRVVAVVRKILGDGRMAEQRRALEAWLGQKKTGQEACR
jgi:ArsR family transcriptional regulator, arsenate/arsenite/antimonite-responsive transcriptional repressor